jgi:hypothetical protein
MTRPPVLRPEPGQDPWANSAFDDAMAQGKRERQRHREIFNRFRSRWDEAAAAAEKGDDFPYRQLADALRRLMRS